MTIAVDLGRKATKQTNKLSMFKALNKGCKQKSAVLFLNQVEGRL